jgi:peptidoglycan/xylan/chitin deacetylase (PgdA/CDA1 family)
MAPLWRAPYGEVNAALAHWAADAGWRHVGWSRDERGGRLTLDSLDWVSERGSRNYLSSAQMAARLLSYDAAGDGLNGGIVLLHLSSRRDDPVVSQLAALIDTLRARGYEPVTVGDLLRVLAPHPLLAVR